jgi:phage tail-like protein
MRGHIDGLATPHPLGPTLPALLQEDELLLRMMTAFDEVLAPVLLALDNLPAHVDPRLCPEDWVDWLGEWVAVPAQPHMPLQQRRTRVAAAHVEHIAGGTVQGLQASLSVALHADVEVHDSGGTSWSPVPGGPLPGTPEPAVTVSVRGSGVTQEQVTALLAELAPAHVRMDVQVSAK